MGGDCQGREKEAESELGAWFDVLPERRKAFSEKYGCAQETAYEETVQRQDLDGVLLVTPTAFHHEQTGLGPKAGNHVYNDAKGCSLWDPVSARALWNNLGGLDKRMGIPDNVQVDNDMTFSGSPTQPRAMGSLIRLCLLF